MKAQEMIQRKFGRRQREYAILGDYDGNVVVPGYNYLNYARVQGVVQLVWNRICDPKPGIEVEIEYQGAQIVVVGLRGRAYPVTDDLALNHAHADSHLEGGSDPVYIWMSQILNLRIVPNGFTIQIWPGRQYAETWKAPARSANWNLATYKPVSGAVWVLIYLKRDGTFVAVEGETVDTVALLTPALIPALPFGGWALAAVRLYASQLTIDAIKDIFDLRWAAMPFNAASGLSTATIVSGEITAYSQFVYIYGEGDANDDLDTINGGAHGSLLTLCAPDHEITIKHGTGNIEVEGGEDIVLTGGSMLRTLLYDDTQDKWLVYGGGAGSITFLDLEDTFASYSGLAEQILRINAEETGIETVAALPAVPIYWKWDSDAPPASPSAYDDEFTDSSLNASLWTEYDHGSLLTVAEDTYGVKLTETYAANNPLCGLYTAIPAGDFTVITKLSLSSQINPGSPAGILLYESPTSSTGNVYFFGVGPKTTAMTLRVSLWTAYNAYSANVVEREPSVINLNSVYLRIRRTSTTYGFDYSNDGIGWIRIYSGELSSFTPTYCGPGMYPTTSGATAYSRFRFWRYIGSDVGLDNVCTGRLVPIGGSALNSPIAEKSTAYTLTPSDGVILGDASGGAFSVTLPTAVGIAGRMYMVKKIDSSANAVTLDGYGSETIDGATTVALSTQYESICVISDGTEWHIIPDVQLYLKLTGGTMTGALTAPQVTVNESGAASGDFRAEGDTEENMIFLDASADAVYLGGSTNGVKVEKGGELSLLGDATVFDDLQVSISNIRIPVSNAPTERLYACGIGSGVTFPFLGFDVDDYIYFDVQTSHSMKLNTVLDNHIHFVLPNTTDIGDKFKFRLDVIAAGINTQWEVPTGSPYYGEHTVAANDNTYHNYLEIAEIASSNDTVSTIYKCKLTRVAASSDEYASEVYLTFSDCHYEKDTMGSKTETSK